VKDGINSNLDLFLGVQNEGWLDPWALLTAFRQKALSLGVLYLNGLCV
jgi:glycine/D-amino acid oxidase-like deaminating enzyme